jgi:hypothetical protein
MASDSFGDSQASKNSATTRKITKLGYSNNLTIPSVPWITLCGVIHCGYPPGPNEGQLSMGEYGEYPPPGKPV